MVNKKNDENLDKDLDNKKKKSGNGEDREDWESFEKIRGKEKGKSLTKKGEEEKLEIEELEEEIKLLRKELDEYKKIEEEYLDRIKRLQADYDNYRKRTLKEQIEHIRRANKDLVEKLLPVIDSFESALEMGKDLKSGEDEFYKGVNMIYQKLMDVLAKEGVKVINPEGEEFNPEICEVATTEVSEEAEEGTVLEVLRKGYMIHDFLIRPAVVKVCVKK